MVNIRDASVNTFVISLLVSDSVDIAWIGGSDVGVVGEWFWKGSIGLGELIGCEPPKYVIGNDVMMIYSKMVVNLHLIILRLFQVHSQRGTQLYQ